MLSSAFSWLHLTDFHYGLKGQDCLWPTLREPFLDSLAALHGRCGPWDAVLFTGDLVQSGETAQFEKMQAEVLNPLWEKLRELGSGDAVLLAVPGNHDLYRPNPNEDNAAIDVLLERDGFQRVEAKFWDQPAGQYRRVINDAFAAYSQWWSTAPHRAGDIKTGALPGDFSVSLQHGDRRIGVVGLNTTFLQLAGGDYEGRLVWDARQIHAVCDGGVDSWARNNDVSLLLTHQGPNWLTQEARMQEGPEIAPAGRFALHLFGHHHETDITYNRGGSSHGSRQYQGLSAFGMDRFGDPPRILRAHGYAAGRIEFCERDANLRLWPLIATNKTGRWRFIPDHGRTELEEDEGTVPEPIAVYPRASGAAPGTSTAAATTEISLQFNALHSTLPARRPFFGRAKDLEKVARYLLPEDRSWGVVLDGPGGVGKTALALEAAHRAPIEHFPFKLWFTAKDRELFPQGVQQLKDHRVTGFYELLSELGRSLGRDDIPKAAPEDRPQLVRHALTNYRALLVLDNLETFSPEERRRVVELLDSLPSACRAIVTSRRRTDGSTAAHNLRLDKLERDAAEELLDELAMRWKPAMLLTQDERDRLYAETGGNPLLLTWTTGQLGRSTGRSRTLTEAIERLREAHRLQRIDEANDPMSYVFGDLAETFTREETEVLAALVHFTQPVHIEWLLSLTDLDRKAAENALDGLRDRALLVEDDQAATWLLPAIAARFLRRERPEAVVISGERLADRACALAVENGYENYSRFSVLEASWPQITAALPVLIAGDDRRLQSVINALSDFLIFSGRWDDLLFLSIEAEAKAERAGDLQSAGERAYDAGFCHFLRGRSAEVLACADRAIAHWQAARAGGDARASAISLRGLGFKLTGNYPAAIASLREALGIWRSLSVKSRNMADSLNYLAESLRDSGQLAEAESYFREALVIAKDFSDSEGVAAYSGNLSELALESGQFTEAERLARESLALAQEVGRKDLIARNSSLLAKALGSQGRGTEGLLYSESAISILKDLRSPELSSRAARKIILMERLSDPDEDVRRMAIERLVRDWPTVEMHDIALSTARHDQAPSVREASIGLLARVFSDDSMTVKLLKEFAIGDEVASIRLRASMELATLGWEAMATRALLRHIVVADGDIDLRSELRSHFLSLKPRLAGLWQDYLNGVADRSSLPETVIGYPAIHVRQFRLRNIGVFSDTGLVSLSSMMNLLVGNNATGKTTVLKCLALAAVGSDAANEVEQGAASYLRRGCERGVIEVAFELIPDPDCFEEECEIFAVGFVIDENSDRFATLPSTDLTLSWVKLNANERLNEIRNESGFSFGLICAYGATRAFSQSRFAIEREHPREANEWVLPLFHSDAGIINPDVLSRVVKGDVRNLKVPSDKLDVEVTNAIRRGLGYLLPTHGEVSVAGPYDIRLNEIDLTFAELSEGYKSLLAVLGHLVRSSLQLTDGLRDPTAISGLVLIDEVDLHLHPEWQRLIVPGLRKAFPGVQFVTSTHSPLIAGTCTPEEIRVMEARGDGSATIKQYKERIYGLDSEQILLSSYFGLDSTRAPGVEYERHRLATLAAEGDDNAAIEFIRSYDGSDSVLED